MTALDHGSTSAPSRHPAIMAYDTEGGELLIGGWPVSRLARRVGQTPFFAYDRSKLSGRIRLLRDALPEQVRLHYAIKANPMPAVVQHLAPLVDGFDVASGDELGVALDTIVSPEHIGFAGPGKTERDLSRAIAAGIVVELESEGEMNRLAALADASGDRARVALRVNPDFRLKGSGMHMGGGASQFGIDAEHVPAVLDRLRELPLEFVGFHIFGGSQNLDSDAVATAEAQIVELAMRLARSAPSPVRHLNIGGGFGIPYFPKDQPLDIHAVGRSLRQSVSAAESAFPEARIVVELGRYIVGEAGVYVCRVIDRKVSRGQVYLVTDGGLHHHLAATGNFGQGIRRNFPVAVANRMTAEPAEPASVVGCLCTPIDLLGDKVPLPEAQVGDLVAVFQSGAYGYTASPRDFLSHPQPAEILV